MNYEKLYAQLRIDEGIRYKRYQDTVDKWTIGVGHNITDDRNYPYQQSEEPLTQSQVNLLLVKDVARAVSDLDQYCNWWRACPEPVQRVICGLAFNMGWPRLSQFKNTLDAMHKANYAEAADHLLDSKYAQQVGERAVRYAEVLRST
jgi:lysozyme